MNIHDVSHLHKYRWRRQPEPAVRLLLPSFERQHSRFWWSLQGNPHDAVSNTRSALLHSCPLSLLLFLFRRGRCASERGREGGETCLLLWAVGCLWYSLAKHSQRHQSTSLLMNIQSFFIHNLLRKSTLRPMTQTLKHWSFFRLMIKLSLEQNNVVCLGMMRKRRKDSQRKHLLMTKVVFLRNHSPFA